jgi:hypothetical protein
LRAPLRQRQPHQALALQRSELRHEHRLALAVRLAVQRHHAAEVLQQRHGGGRQRMPAREAARLVEHARRVFAAHAQRLAQHEAGAEHVGAEALEAVGRKR